MKNFKTRVQRAVYITFSSTRADKVWNSLSNDRAINELKSRLRRDWTRHPDLYIHRPLIYKMTVNLNGNENRIVIVELFILSVC